MDKYFEEIDEIIKFSRCFHIQKYIDGGPDQETASKYSTINQVINELYGGNAEIRFEDDCGYLNILPLGVDGKLYYKANLIVPRTYTIFIYHCVRYGICDGDYRVTNYIISDNNLLCVNDAEIIKRLYKEYTQEH